MLGSSREWPRNSGRELVRVYSRGDLGRVDGCKRGHISSLFVLQGDEDI